MVEEPQQSMYNSSVMQIECYGVDKNGRFANSKQAIEYNRGNQSVSDFWKPQNLLTIDDEYFIGRDIQRQKIQINQSLDFLLMLKYKYLLKYQKVIECGCGNGRVTEGVLSKLFTWIDIIDFNKDFIDLTKKRFSNSYLLHNSYQTSFQNHQFTSIYKYDLVWCQWTLCYLNDEEAIIFLLKAKKALSQKGAIVIKQNVDQINKGFYYENSSGQVHRSESLLRYLFYKAELKIVEEVTQTDETFPGIPLKIYCLAPL